MHRTVITQTAVVASRYVKTNLVSYTSRVKLVFVLEKRQDAACESGFGIRRESFATIVAGPAPEGEKCVNFSLYI